MAATGKTSQKNDYLNAKALAKVGAFFIPTSDNVYSPTFLCTHAIACIRLCAIIRVSIGVSLLTESHRMSNDLTD